ncbi:MAG: molybdopterin-synthase adenylyltransferase MoeB [Deltaproteobacteria bacterium]
MSGPGISVLFGFIAVALAYVIVLRALKRRAYRPVQIKEAQLNPTELDRYARHITLREIGGAGQVKLSGAKVLVIGAGGLGSGALPYLAAAGIGTIGIIDDDLVENTNLQRQVIHDDAMVGEPKVKSAMRSLKRQNPYVNVHPYQRRLDASNAEALFESYDLVLDGTDNFETRYLVNRVATNLKKPLIAAALTQWEGQISLYDPAHGTPCYQCIFPEAPARELVPSCAEAGVLSSLPGVIGALMASEAIKHITGAGQTLAGRLLMWDALDAESRVIKIRKRDDCPVCGATATTAPKPQ